MVGVLRRYALRTLYDSQYRTGFGLTSFRWPGRPRVLESIRNVWRNRDIELAPLAAYQLFVTAEATRKVPGEMAEVGVFRGGSAKLIHDAIPEKALHLFDTFEGSPETNDSVDRRFHKGQFACTLQDVREYLGGLSNLYFHKGLFPSTAASVAGRQFCFVHLDVDLYQSTRDALTFFYPRMNQGGCHSKSRLCERRRADESICGVFRG